jgi:hypothetical protein
LISCATTSFDQLRHDIVDGLELRGVIRRDQVPKAECRGPQPEDGEIPAVISCITQTKEQARAELETLPGVTPEWIEKRLVALPE